MTFFAARQPILDTQKKVVAYELLFRESLENVFPDTDEEAATAKMVEGLQNNLGLDNLAKDKLAFVNFTQASLLKGYPLLLPKDQLVVEILETATPNKALLQVCKDLKSRGYKIALDDYEHKAVWLHFFPHVDIIKVDFKVSSPTQVAQIANICKSYSNLQLLAEKVETYEEFRVATELGFSYFQGYFFSKPEIVKRQSLDPSQLALAALISEISVQEPDIEKMTRAIEADVNLSFKLLRFTQSAMFKRKKTIENIKQAVIAIGLEELRRFISMLFTAQFTNSKPMELTTLANNRAHFCEDICRRTGREKMKASAFLVGMLSLLDAMLDADINELIKDLSLSRNIKLALLERQGPLSLPLGLCEYFEKGDWTGAQTLADSLNISLQDANDSYLQAIKLTAEKMEAMV